MLYTILGRIFCNNISTRDMDIVDQQSKIPLSSDDIYRMLGKKTRIMTYRQLMERKHIDDVLEPFNSCVVLYETAKGWGHWIAIIFRPPNIVEVFDPYGYKPDEQRKFIPKNFIKHYPHKHLVKLLIESPYEIHYNHAELQDRKNKKAATCGRWVVVRILCRDMDEHDFKTLMTGGIKNPDNFVTLCTLGLP